jgi:predicted PurR-regulated permease PerM
LLNLVAWADPRVDSLDDLLKISSAQIIRFVFEQSVGLSEFLLMSFFYLLFLILGADKLPGRVRRAFPGERSTRVLEIAAEISQGIEQFMRVKTLVSVGMGVTAAVILYLFGMQQWLLWGFLFFALNYITYIGSIAACVPPILLAFVELKSSLAAGVLTALIVANRVFWIDFLEIRFSGKRLNISSILIFLWLAYWGWVWGVVGLILAYPMIVSLKFILEHFPSTRGWAHLMAEE